MLKMHSSRPYIPALMSYVTKDFITANVRHGSSQNEKSRYTFFKRIKKFTNLLIGNSSLLLRGIGLIGVITSLTGLVFAFTVVMRKLFGAAIEPGWSFLVVIDLVLGGFILIALSIIGEYLFRIIEGNDRKPTFIVRRIIKHHSKSFE